MKTKKLLFLTAILMVLTSTVAVAQRGTCTPGATNAYIGINGTWTDDKTEALGATYLVPEAATVQVGSDPYVDKASIDFTIDVSKDGVFQFQINKANVTSYGTQAWNPTLPASLFTAGSTVKAVMTITPNGTGTVYYGCTTSWKYTYTLNTPSGCLSPNPIPYYNNNSAGWVNKLTTNYNIPLDMKAGKTIIVGINPSSGATLAWTSTGMNNGFTGTAQEFTFDPMLVNPGDSTTLVGVYTDLCGKVTTYTYVLSVPLVCTPVLQTITQANYQAGTAGWHDALIYAPIGEIHILAGETITFGPWPTDGSKYVYSWSGAGASKLNFTNVREPVYNDNDTASCLLTATITYDDGCNPAATASYTFKIIVDDGIPLAVDKFEQRGFKMYPNPVNNILNVTYNGDLKVSITNIAGQQILSPRSISKQGSVDVSSLSAGVYFLKADANGESIVRKFVKN